MTAPSNKKIYLKYAELEKTWQKFEKYQQLLNQCFNLTL